MPRLEMQPDKFLPAAGKLCIKRKTAPAERKGIILPPGSKKSYAAGEGSVVALCDNPSPEFAELTAGDTVYFSPEIGHDDSVFFSWNGEDYIIMPLEAVQGFVPMEVANAT